jgi:hypothetical protein
MGFWEVLIGEEPTLLEKIFNYDNLGQYGEYLTKYAINNLNGYLRIINNLYIPNKGRHTEIDVLMVHEKGIFVFESKNYSGWIFGSVESQKWTQVFPNGEKHQFYNPVLQNKIHINAISQFLDLPVSAFSSYIIFSERCELKKIPDDTEAFTILRRNCLLRNLRGALENRNVIYTKEQVNTFYEKLYVTSQTEEQEKEKHIEGIKERTEGTTCPFCGGELILRNGKYGAFYGCKNYPKCNFTRRIK